MPVSHWFSMNDQAFEVEEGSPTWERLIGEGILPDDAGDGPDAPTRDELAAKATDLGIVVKGNWGVPKLLAAISDAEASAITVADTPGPDTTMPAPAFGDPQL